MPVYEIQHAIPLSISQRDELAAAITTIHSSTFTTPKLFVQVYFTDVAERPSYVGGKRSLGNHIRGSVRTGASRSQDEWNNLCSEIAAAWDRIAGTPLPTKKGGKEFGSTELRSVILMGGMVAGWECGFTLPQAGQDVQWIRENMEGFRKKASEGDEEFADLVREVEERGFLNGTNGANGTHETNGTVEMNGENGHMTAVQKLEEALGWGDAA